MGLSESMPQYWQLDVQEYLMCYVWELHQESGDTECGGWLCLLPEGLMRSAETISLDPCYCSIYFVSYSLQCEQHI